MDSGLEDHSCGPLHRCEGRESEGTRMGVFLSFESIQEIGFSLVRGHVACRGKGRVCAILTS
jgi:hypothetical protein